jgi:UDP-3-O-[3-hydroxymyristoyl] glucosamine N-acyltransferase
MSLTVAEIAAKLGGSFDGDGSARIEGVAGLRDAIPGLISFLANPRYEAEVATTKASAVLVGEGWSGSASAAVIRVRDPNAAFAEVVSWFAKLAPPPLPGVHPTAIIAPGAKIGNAVSIGPYVVIEAEAVIGDRTIIGAGGLACVVGADCRFYPHVSLREFTRVGDRVIVHNGAVIGSDGFGYNREKGKWKKIPQTGIVVIGDDVELGANMTIDRARFGETRIGSGTKIDNLVQVAHNVTIGADTAIASQTGISGSTSIGSRVQIGGQVGFAGHISLGDDCIVAAQAGVHKSAPNGTALSGTPAIPYGDWLKLNAHIQRLPELKQRVAEMAKRLRSLEGGKDEG